MLWIVTVNICNPSWSTVLLVNVLWAFTVHDHKWSQNIQLNCACTVYHHRHISEMLSNIFSTVRCEVTWTDIFHTCILRHQLLLNVCINSQLTLCLITSLCSYHSIRNDAFSHFSAVWVNVRYMLFNKGELTVNKIFIC